LGKKLGCNYACNWKKISNPTPLATGKNIPLATTVVTEKIAQLQPHLQLEKYHSYNLNCN
jgi:hypothetical protein